MEAIAAGSTLKSHRDIDGQKIYRLYDPEGNASPIDFDQVQRLLERRLLTTNQKFPAATFLLTSKGQKMLQSNQKPRGIGAIVKFDSSK